MNNDLNFSSWQIEEPSSEKIDEILSKAKSRVVQRKRRRRIGAGAFAVLIASLGVFYGLFNKFNFGNELTEARGMIEKDISNNRDIIFYAENER